MSIAWLEQWIGYAGGGLAAALLLVAFWGMGRGLRHSAGRATGQTARFLRLPYYLLVSGLFFGMAWVTWRPLSLTLSNAWRAAALAVGALLYFPGLALWLWGRRTLGQMFNVSSGFGAQLFADHHLITHGPFAYTRHPMYLGVIGAAFGSLLMYRTWASVFLAVCSLGLIVRAWREEQALAAEFGARWAAYCQRVPKWRPRFPSKGDLHE